MPLPNFLIIGAVKSGTSSLYNYFSQHPEIYMSPLKELRFFAYDSSNPNHRSKVPQGFPITNMDDYIKQFDGVTNEKAIGEASPNYLSSNIAAIRIKESLPNVKLIASLRNPVDQAYSLYQMKMRNTRYTIRDIKAHDASFHEPKDNAGFYYPKLKRYFDIFDHSQIKVIIFEEWIANPSKTLIEIFQFLEVNDTFQPQSRIFYPGGLPKNRLIDNIFRHRRFFYKLKPFLPENIISMFRSVRERNLVKAPPLTKEKRQQLARIYHDDTLALQGLIQKDLSIWLNLSSF